MKNNLRTCEHTYSGSNAMQASLAELRERFEMGKITLNEFRAAMGMEPIMDGDNKFVKAVEIDPERDFLEGIHDLRYVDFNAVQKRLDNGEIKVIQREGFLWIYKTREPQDAAENYRQ